MAVPLDPKSTVEWSASQDNAVVSSTAADIFESTRLGEAVETMKTTENAQAKLLTALEWQAYTNKWSDHGIGIIHEWLSKAGKDENQIRWFLEDHFASKFGVAHDYKGLVMPDKDGHYARWIASKFWLIPTWWHDDYLRAQQMLAALRHEQKNGKLSSKKISQKRKLESFITEQRESMSSQQKEQYDYQSLQLSLAYTKKHDSENQTKIEKISENIKRREENMTAETVKKRRIIPIFFAPPGESMKGWVHLDTGGAHGIESEVRDRSNEQELVDSSFFVDHHGETNMAPSTTTMIREWINKLGYNIPKAEKEKYEKLVSYMNVFDNMWYELVAAKLKKWDRSCRDLLTLWVYAPEIVREYFQENPQATGFETLPESYMDKKVLHGSKGKEVTLQELAEKLENQLEEIDSAIEQKIQNDEYVEIKGQKYLVLTAHEKHQSLRWGEFAFKIGSALSRGYNVLQVHPDNNKPGDVYIYSAPNLTEEVTEGMGQTIRDHIWLIKKQEAEYEERLTSLCSMMSDDVGMRESLESYLLWTNQAEGQTDTESGQMEANERPANAEQQEKKSENVTEEEVTQAQQSTADDNSPLAEVAMPDIPNPLPEQIPQSRRSKLKGKVGERWKRTFWRKKTTR